MSGGFVAVYRKIRKHFVWESGRARTKFEAWLDIIMEVQHSPEPQAVLIKGRLLCCHRGQSLKSLVTWAERWGWSKSKVGRFFKILVDEQMIILESERVTTRLTVVNYDHYNPPRNAGKHSGGTQTSTHTERKSEWQPEQSSDDKAKACDNEQNVNETANNKQTEKQTSHRRQSEQRQQGEQDSSSRKEQIALLEPPIVDMGKILKDVERFTKRLEEAFAPMDKRNRASFHNLRHAMYEHARKVDSNIFLVGISLISKAAESEVIQNKQAWVMQSIKNRMAERNT